jgi:hypothetical protein
MAKKDLDKLLDKAEEGNKNLGGVNSLFTTTGKSEKKGEAKEAEPIEQLKTYSLQIEKSLFKNLELRRVETGVSIKQQIIDAIKRCYNL